MEKERPIRVEVHMYRLHYTYFCAMVNYGGPADYDLLLINAIDVESQKEYPSVRVPKANSIVLGEEPE